MAPIVVHLSEGKRTEVAGDRVEVLEASDKRGQAGSLLVYADEEQVAHFKSTSWIGWEKSERSRGASFA